MKRVTASLAILVTLCSYGVSEEIQPDSRVAELLKHINIDDKELEDFENSEDDDDDSPSLEEICGRVNPVPTPEAVPGMDDPMNVVGGSDTWEGKFPWMAIITVGKYFCGGVLISDSYVITAAHCVDLAPSPSDAAVYLGVYDIRVFTGKEEYRGVRKLIAHPDYNPSTYEHDIGIIEMSSKVNYTRYIAPLCIPLRDYEWESGTERCVVAGWGYLYYGGSISFILQEAEVGLWDSAQCLEEFPLMKQTGNVHPHTLCGGEIDGGRGPCHGDSGGPMMCRREGQEYYAGVVSTSYGCAWPGRPAVFTDVGKYVDWISKETGLDDSDLIDSF